MSVTIKILKKQDKMGKKWLKSKYGKMVDDSNIYQNVGFHRKKLQQKLQKA